MRHNCEYLTYIHLGANWWDNPGTVKWKEGGRKWSQFDMWYCLWMYEGLRTSVRTDGLWTEVRTAGVRTENFKTGGPRSQDCMPAGPWTEDLRTAGPRTENLKTAGPRTEDIWTASIWTKDLTQDSWSTDWGPYDSWPNNWGPLSGQLFQGLRTFGRLINEPRKLVTAAGLWTEDRTPGNWINNLPDKDGTMGKCQYKRIILFHENATIF